MFLHGFELPSSDNATNSFMKARKPLNRKMIFEFVKKYGVGQSTDAVSMSLSCGKAHVVHFKN